METHIEMHLPVFLNGTIARTAGCREQCSGRTDLRSVRHLAVDHTAEVCALAVLPAALGKFVLICGNLPNLA